MKRPYTETIFREAFDRFDFEQVRALMFINRWTYRSAKEPPTVEEMKDTVLSLYTSLEYGDHYRENSRTSTGGFSVCRWTWESSIEIEIIFKWQATSATMRVENKKDTSYQEGAEQAAIYAQRIMELEKLLNRAAEALQEFTAEVDGDMNNALAMEIWETLKR